MNQEEECDTFCGVWGKCHPNHSIHCCHFVVTLRRAAHKPGWILVGYGCKKGCGKISKNWMLRKE